MFEHKVVRPHNPLVRGFDEVFYAAAFQAYGGAEIGYQKAC